ncbi:diguanylate cyclase domain-containing protein [Desulfosporosinus sp. BICA1-9]|uniref:diguanylate cyclase domain-containing protein n=1 Tax=Desulfosporosinus sp. BICA1-9 TaxID=1531958 RepID=UPI000A69130A|nr:diguanylate cyclase [Desulfosporosinus sp. BICA1-9]
MFGAELVMSASLGAIIVIFTFYIFIYFLDRSQYIGWLTIGWFMSFISNFFRYIIEVSSYNNDYLLYVNGLFYIISNLCIFKGTLLHVNMKPPKWLISGGLVFILNIIIGLFILHVQVLSIIATLFFVGVIRFWAGILLLKSSTRGSIQYCLGWSFILLSTNFGPLSLTFLDGKIKFIIYFAYQVVALSLAIGFLMLYIKQTNESYKQDEQHIKYFNIHDKLTGVYNRDFYEDIIQHLVNNSEQIPLAIILCDVNGLKLINDTLGHKQGDELIKKVANLLASICRKDDLVVRWGGDEFLVILPSTSNGNAKEIATRVRAALALCPPEPIPLSMAIGVATLTNQGESIEDVFNKAEEDMYTDKLREGNNTKLAVINALGQLLFIKDYETKEHVDRLESLVREMGLQLDLPESLIKNYCLVAKLHDIGKITIPEYILRKQGPLNSTEWECMKKHAESGYRLALSTSEFASIAEAILYHHEHWDGNGYPQGLSGHDIPLSSRIIAIADAYDVMVHNRSYKKAMSEKDALNELIRCAGTQFDPDLVRVFIKLMMLKLDETG